MLQESSKFGPCALHSHPKKNGPAATQAMRDFGVSKQNHGSEEEEKQPIKANNRRKKKHPRTRPCMKSPCAKLREHVLRMETRMRPCDA